MLTSSILTEILQLPVMTLFFIMVKGSIGGYVIFNFLNKEEILIDVGW